jgi:hypothetical protein
LDRSSLEGPGRAQPFTPSRSAKLWLSLLHEAAGL